MKLYYRAILVLNIQVSHRGVNIRHVLKAVEVEQKQKHVNV